MPDEADAFEHLPLLDACLQRIAAEGLQQVTAVMWHVACGMLGVAADWIDLGLIALETGGWRVAGVSGWLRIGFLSN